MTTPQYTIRLTVGARRMLTEVNDRRVHRLLVERIEKLAVEPEKQGKPLVDELAGYRGVRAVGQRYRIVYTILQAEVVVMIVLVGLRKHGSKKDVYEVARKLIRQGLIDPPMG